MSVTPAASGDLGRAGAEYFSWQSRVTLLLSRLNLRVAAPAIGGGGGLATLGAANGGYFETAWGWSSLALLWVAAVGLVLRTDARLGRLELGFAASIVGLGAWTLAS